MFSVKKAAFAIVLLVVLQIVLIAFLCNKQFDGVDSSLIDFTIVIDAGHGGIDGGVQVDSVKESTLNLQYAKTLGKLLDNAGFNVVYTRTNDNGLYGLPTKGFKLRDMKARKKIIDDARPNMVISVHMNKFPQSSRGGPQVFYQQGKKDGQLLANSVQQVFNEFTQLNREALSGDYYVCREVDCPSIIVECGFLSNASDFYNLQQQDYQQKICNMIFNGIMLYLYN